MYFSKYKAHYFVVTMFLLSISLPNVKNTVSFLDSIVGALPVQQHSWPPLTATRRRRLTAPNMEPPSPYSSRTEGCREILCPPWQIIHVFNVRLDAEMSPTTIRVSPVEGERNMFYVRLRTSHYSFSIKNTCVVRSLQSFYQLRSILKVSFRFRSTQGWIVVRLSI